ncbi:MAG: 50S ribosomal protein L18 [Candidatus Portnoybacteria bacterium CG10_big_fil_rev_8_21_14_0_10_36_7]|uniref:Large ribosomal subunit protein uL18 n=1 Tax=Candidatus Portnoybacteria bacterium CG10_big_fil_rev_8_21_14_0_10_36_7 TaxID=1974812 RepID=A0A2M8KDG3_9BACT|nr:MAG: 50S ribosomal protein L18 [Candidatus Portnoybacteria bacterium CG10_big_fil_rev_8_21_14_0_10_36_7]
MLAKRVKRHKKIRARIKGTKNRPRLSVFRSTKYLQVQLINDGKGETLLGVTDKAIKMGGKKMTKIESAKELGKVLAEKAIKQKIDTVVFDRGGFKYHGRIKSLADSAREGGLKF